MPSPVVSGPRNHVPRQRSQRQTLLVVNPASAGGKTFARFDGLRGALERHHVDADVRLTLAPGEATELTRDALLNGCTQIISVGGDGTLNEVVNGYFNAEGAPINQQASLGIIPSGSGGDFRRSLGIMTMETAVAAIARGNSRQIDAGKIEGVGSEGPHYFINIVDWGFGGEVVARVNRNRFKGGGLRGSAVFLAISLSEGLTYGFHAVDLVIDGKTYSRRVSNVVISNGQYFGGGMRVAPRAKLDDGKFDVVIVGEMSKPKLVANMFRVYRGTHLGAKGVEYTRAQRIQIIPREERPLRFEAEGEELGAGEATVTCLPGAVRFICP